MMSITLPPAALPCAMVISAVILACWLGNQKNRILDAIAFQIAVFCIAWLLFSAHVR